MTSTFRAYTTQIFRFDFNELVILFDDRLIWMRPPIREKSDSQHLLRLIRTDFKFRALGQQFVRKFCWVTLVLFGFWLSPKRLGFIGHRRDSSASALVLLAYSVELILTRLQYKLRNIQMKSFYRSWVAFRANERPLTHDCYIDLTIL